MFPLRETMYIFSAMQIYILRRLVHEKSATDRNRIA